MRKTVFDIALQTYQKQFRICPSGIALHKQPIFVKFSGGKFENYQKNIKCQQETLTLSAKHKVKQTIYLNKNVFNHRFITLIFTLSLKKQLQLDTKVASVYWDTDLGRIKNTVLLARKIAREDDLNMLEIKRFQEITLVITDDDFSRE